MRIGGRKYAAEVARRKAQQASNLRRLRDGRAWTQHELGRRLGMVAAALELPPVQVLAKLDAPSAAEAT